MSTHTVLFTEDNAMLRELISAKLDAHRYAVVLALTGDEALSILESGGIDVLVTDVSMPGTLDGWELAEQARLINPEIAVIYSSGRRSDTARQVSRSLYVQKPYRPDAIVAAIRQLTTPRDDGGEDGDGSCRAAPIPPWQRGGP